MNTNTLTLLKDILDKSRAFFEHFGLKPFLLSLPLQGPSAETNKDGIREKILKNNSQLLFELETSDSSNESPDRKIDTINRINEIVNKLTQYDTVGFVVLITEYVGDDSNQKDIPSTSTPNQHRPLAGAIVEFVDEYERAIRAMWCRRSLPNMLVKLIIQVMTLQIIAYSFNCEHPSLSAKQRIANKLLSIVDSHCIAFPQDAYTFLTSSNGLNLGKHWETPEHGGHHSDAPFRKCQCSKLANKENAFQFWGISETRFLSNWNHKKDILIPTTPSPEIKDMFFNIKKGRCYNQDSENQLNSSNKVPKT